MFKNSMLVRAALGAATAALVVSAGVLPTAAAAPSLSGAPTRVYAECTVQAKVESDHVRATADAMREYASKQYDDALVTAGVNLSATGDREAYKAAKAAAKAERTRIRDEASAARKSGLALIAQKKKTCKENGGVYEHAPWNP